MFSSESEPSLVLFSIFLKDLKIIIERKKKMINMKMAERLTAFYCLNVCEGFWVLTGSSM